MKTVIGLGGAGCKIADKFAQREGYKIYKIDENLQGTRCYSFKKISSMEEAESSVSSLKSFFKGLTKDVLFIVAGGGKISGASLAILEQIRNKNVEILYVRPDLDTLSGVNIQSEKIVSQVLQNMTRSGVFQKMYLFDNQKIQEILQGVSLLKLNDSINEVIARSYDLTNFYQGQESVFGQSGQVDEISRIATFGFISFDDDIPRMCFDLENMKSLQYSVHPSEYEGVQAYCRLHTHYIQQEEN